MQLSDSFIADIKIILASARRQAYAAINASMVNAYWYLGKRIVEEEQQGEEKKPHMAMGF